MDKAALEATFAAAVEAGDVDRAVLQAALGPVKFPSIADTVFAAVESKPDGSALQLAEKLSAIARL